MNPILVLTTARKAVVFSVLRLCSAGIPVGIFLLLCAPTLAQSIRHRKS